MPDSTTQTKLTNAQRRSLLKKDIYRELSTEKAFWADYQEKQNKENNKSSIISFVTGVIGGIAGFMTAGIPGMKAGYGWGSTVGKAGRLLDKGRFNPVEHLRGSKSSIFGKFNISDDKLQFDKIFSEAKDNEAALHLDLGLDIFKSVYATGLSKNAEDIHGLSQKDWRDTKWWKRPKIAFKDMAKSQLEKSMEILDKLKSSEGDTDDILSIFDEFPANKPSLYENTKKDDWGPIPFNTKLGDMNKAALTAAFGDILMPDTIDLIASDNPASLMNKINNGIKNNNLEEILSEDFKIDFSQIDTTDMSIPVDSLKIGDNLIEDNLLGDNDIDTRINIFGASMIAPPMPVTDEVADSLMHDPLNYGSVNMSNPSELEDLDPFIIPDKPDFLKTDYQSVSKALDYINLFGKPHDKSAYPIDIPPDIFDWVLKNYNKTLSKGSI